MNTFPMTDDVVLIGGGHTHALVLRMWGMKPMAGARLTLINPGPTAPYSGMLPGHIAGHYARAELDINLVKLARFAGARLIIGAAEGIDLDARTVQVPGRPPIAFDLCSVDIGVTARMPKLKGFAEHGIPAKPLAGLADAWAHYLTLETQADIVVLGGGVAGIELAMAMAHALHARSRPYTVTVLDRGAALTALRPGTAKILRKKTKDLGIQIKEQAEVTEIGATFVTLKDGTRLSADFVTGAAGAHPYPWLAETGLNHTDGFLDVSPTLQTSDPDIFAVGDCAHLTVSPRPKAGVYAVREAPFLLDNLRARLSGASLRSYTPQDDYLKLISLGDKAAIGEKFGVAPHGHVMWQLKDWIDQKFMNQFRDLPVMEAPERPALRTAGFDKTVLSEPPCGGCGAKVGRAALSTAVTGPFDDAATLSFGEKTQVISTDHLSAVTEDPALMARIAAVHALGDIWAMGASPQVATATIILPRMSATLQHRTLDEIMQNARAVFDAAGAKIVGGHTTTGDTLTIGFTITGLCDAPLTISGAQPGDRLILTKPIGTGVLLASEMRLSLKGEYIQPLFDCMTQPLDKAAQILSGAHAMTDVTGFGLAGHVLNICEHSGVAARITLADVPLLPGALEQAQAGVRSTLYPDNRALAPHMAETALTSLLFDPQTCGGLLAAVPGSEATDRLEALRAAGYTAALIGEIVTGAPTIDVL